MGHGLTMVQRRHSDRPQSMNFDVFTKWISGNYRISGWTWMIYMPFLVVTRGDSFVSFPIVSIIIGDSLD